MNQIVHHPGMMRQFRKQRFKDLATLALVCKRPVSLRSSDVECQSVENGGFGVIWIAAL